MLLILLLAIFLKSLVWWAVVPVWQAPDEQAHFAQLQNYAEAGPSRGLSLSGLSREIALSEERLGTKRDQFGNNRFTYHPEYKIEYTNTLAGKHEEEINNQPKSSRTEYVGKEAAGYPPLYYALAAPIYGFFDNSGLIDRVFAVRLISLVCHLLLVLVVYRIGRMLWEDKMSAVVLAALVSFQPMVSFVAAGFHPDSLLNLLAAVLVLAGLRILRGGARPGDLGVLGAVGIAGVATKQFALFLLPAVAALAALSFFRAKRLGWAAAGGILLFPVFAFLGQLPIPYMPQGAGGISLRDYLVFRVPKLFFETWPWFWGVFKWLGVTLPIEALRVINRVVLVAGVGTGVFAVRMVRGVGGAREGFLGKAFAFFILISVSYLLYFLIWDWRLMQATGFSLGLQGRYFFPVIVPFFAILLVGADSLLPRKIKRAGWGFLVLGMIALNIFALKVVAAGYYDVSSWQTFIVQLAQYKPGLIKMFASLFLI